MTLLRSVANRPMWRTLVFKTRPRCRYRREDAIRLPFLTDEVVMVAEVEEVEGLARLTRSRTSNRFPVIGSCRCSVGAASAKSGRRRLRAAFRSPSSSSRWVGNAEPRSLEILNRRHPNLLLTLGAWQVEGSLVIAMELADQTLHDRFEAAVQEGHRGIPGAELLEYLREASNGIDFLNSPQARSYGGERVGVQHRDIKPQNILCVGSGVKVADFGLVRFLAKSVTGHTGQLDAGLRRSRVLPRPHLEPLGPLRPTECPTRSSPMLHQRDSGSHPGREPLEGVGEPYLAVCNSVSLQDATHEY